MRYALIEPLRGIAALWVFGYHYGFSKAFQEDLSPLHTLMKIGAFGVPMFFVISGFCITASARSTIRKDESCSNFLYRRMRRIYPTYWLSILVVISLPFLIEGISSLKTGVYMAPSPDHPDNGYLKYQPSDWLAVVTLTQAFADVPNATHIWHKFTPINAVYWTLAIEVQFYLVATLAVASKRSYYQTMLLVTALSIPTLFIVSLFASGIFLPFWPMFAIGILLYWMFEKGITPTRMFGRYAIPIAVVALLASVAVVAGIGVWNVSHLAFAAIFGAVLFFAEPLDRWFASQVLASERLPVKMIAGLMVALGAMSYSLYLLHTKLLLLALVPLHQVLPVNSIAFDLLAIAITCVGCYAFYLVCERRFVGQTAAVKQAVIESPTPAAAGVATSG